MAAGDAFFGSLRYNVVCKHGHRGYSPNPAGYTAGFRVCVISSHGEGARSCGGELRIV